MITADRIFQLIDERGITAYKLAKDIGITTSNISAWKKGTLPKIEAYAAIANYFNVSIDYLVGHDIDLKQPSNLSPELNELLVATQDLPPDKIKAVTEIVKAMK